MGPGGSGPEPVIATCNVRNPLKTEAAKIPSLFHLKCGSSGLDMHMNQPDWSAKDNCAHQVVRQKRELADTHEEELFHLSGDFCRHTHPVPHPNPNHSN